MHHRQGKQTRYLALIGDRVLCNVLGYASQHPQAKVVNDGLQFIP